MTKAQSRVFDAIVAWWKKKKCAPSLEELAASLGQKSISTVHVHIQGLIAQGLVRRTDRMRGIEIISDVCPACGRAVRKS